jgi:Pyruvate/2-oxoacid:ferredoxin oxidoreductase gamma subunit
MVSRDALLSSVAHRVPKGTVETNLKAVKLGYKLAEGVRP